MPDILTSPGVLAGAAALLAAAGAAVWLRPSLKPWTSYLHARPILTTNERDFFYRLQRALPTHHIFAQVSFSALISLDSQLSQKRQFALRQRYGWKIADFVICRPDTFDVLAIVELDDRTHVASADRKRDAITRAAGYPTLRFQSRNKPSVKELADLFAKLLPTREQGREVPGSRR